MVTYAYAAAHSPLNMLRACQHSSSLRALPAIIAGAEASARPNVRGDVWLAAGGERTLSHTWARPMVYSKNFPPRLFARRTAGEVTLRSRTNFVP